MADPKNAPQITEPTQVNPYREALFTAWSELAMLIDEEKQLMVKKARLKQTCDALWPLAFPEEAGAYPDINSMTLADAIRLMVQCYCEPNRTLSIQEIRGKLQDVGYDLSKYKNPLASIHTAASRMVESGELDWFDDEGKKLMAGEKLKPIATGESDGAVSALSAIFGSLGENSAGEK